MTKIEETSLTISEIHKKEIPIIVEYFKNRGERWKDRGYSAPIISKNGIATITRGLGFQLSDIKSGEFVKMVEAIKPTAIYCGKRNLYEVVCDLGYSDVATLNRWWLDMGLIVGYTISYSSDDPALEGLSIWQQ